MEVTSTAFLEGEAIPQQYTCDGANISPPLSWTGMPAGTESFAIICDDPDAAHAAWVHWVIFNLSGNATGLPEGLPTERKIDSDAHQGLNSGKKIGYSGPCPPPGPPHRYVFTLYALDTRLDLIGDPTKEQLLRMMQGHILAEARIMARYGR